MIAPILHSQSEVLALLNNRLRNVAHVRWFNNEVNSSINMALQGWHKRVLIPYIYTLPNGWSTGTYDFALPDYMEGPITPQALRFQDYPYPVYLGGTPHTWHDIQVYDVEANGSGGQTLRLGSYSYSTQGRILWWGYNGPIPTTGLNPDVLPVLSASIDADDTSLTLTTKPVVGRSGFIKSGSEWMQYAGLTEGDTTLTLNNLVRGVNGTTAAPHNSGVTVEWGIAMDNGGLLDQLQDSARSYLMEHNLMNGSSQEADHYEKMMLYYRQRADMFWRTYSPARAPKLKLSRMGIGIY